MEWMLFALLAAVFAALVGILGKIGITNLDSTLATTVRAVVMATFLVLVAFSLGKAKLLSTIDSRAFMFIFFSGIAGALSWLFYFFALKSGPAGAVAALDRLSVVFVIVLAALFLGEQLSWRSGVGAVLLTIGAILITLNNAQYMAVVEFIKTRLLS